MVANNADTMHAVEAGGRFAIGLSMALLNCALSSAGFTLQRYSHLLSEQEGTVEDEEDDDDDLKKPWQAENSSPSPPHVPTILSCLGVVLYILAAIPDVISYTLVPQVVCTTVACFRLVVMTFLAHFLLKEHVAGREVLGMLACTCGTLLCLLFGPKNEDIDQATSAAELNHPAVWTYLAGGLSLLLVLLVAEHSVNNGVCRLPEEVHYVVLPLATGLAFALEKVFNTELGFVVPPRCFGAESLSTCFQDLQEDPWWVGMVVMIALLGITDFYLNMRSARKMPVQVFVPISFALCTTLQFFQSLFIFGEFSNMTGMNAFLSISGAVISLVGAIMIKPPQLSLLEHGFIYADGSENSDSDHTL